MDNNLQTFLLDNELNDKVFDKIYYGRMQIHKEKYDDRFIILYVKDYSENLKQSDYEIGGYLDIKDRNIYNCNYRLSEMISKSDLISLVSFGDLDDKLSKDISNYIKKYAFTNEKELMNLTKEEYKNTSEWISSHHKKEVRENFIVNENPIIEFEDSYSDYIIRNSTEYRGQNLYIDYLNSPEETVKKCSKKIIDYKDNKVKLGLELSYYYDKVNYLNSIKENKDNTFSNIYINKKMYNSIKDIDAKTLNITIHYGGKDLTFKYEYQRLKTDLTNDELGSGGYGVAYDKVSDFIKENDTTQKNNRWREDFLFDHVSSITYGKKELYSNTNILPSKELENDEIELEI